MRERVARSGSRGNAVLEMALYMPFGVLLLFVAADAGIYFVEKAAISDIVRGGLNVSVSELRDSPFISTEVGDDLLGLDEEALNSASRSVSEAIGRQISSLKQSLPNSGLSSFYAAVTPVIVDVAPESGALEMNSLRFLRPAISHLGRSAPPPFAGAQAGTPFSAEDYVRRQLLLEPLHGPSQYALGLGPRYSAHDFEPELRFLGQTAFLYVEVVTEANAVNPGVLNFVLGRRYRVSEQELMPLRTLVR